jgi:hypothetical protein
VYFSIVVTWSDDAGAAVVWVVVVVVVVDAGGGGVCARSPMAMHPSAKLIAELNLISLVVVGFM